MGALWSAASRGEDAVTELGVGHGKSDPPVTERVGIGPLETRDQALKA